MLPALPAFPPLPLLSPSSYLCSYDAASAKEDGALDEDLEEEEMDEDPAPETEVGRGGHVTEPIWRTLA